MCETWSLNPRDRMYIGVFEDKVLRRLFGPKSEEVIGGCRKVHNEEFHNFYSSPNVTGMVKSS
jgi:hypothetical protein